MEGIDDLPFEDEDDKDENWLKDVDRVKNLDVPWSMRPAYQNCLKTIETSAFINHQHQPF